ncbi:uncharacterized protein LOC132299058 [Cornus florida]|uniref:uncharacterized protein LOC132299058 n=1 Tax=Cornus florida TaxID=4283 RepID=UPI0028998E3C|nr:uncharacterized protein LOC132299058 [Cornus florida]
MDSFSIDKRPRFLKDFLTDESNSCDSTVRSLLQLDLRPNNTTKLLRTRSRTASMAFSAIHRASEVVINAVKHLPIRSVRSPSLLPRNISRRLSKRKNDCVLREISVTVKVRDILRLKSFRDLIEEKSPPLDFDCSPHRCTTTTTTTTRTESTSTSASSSWCDSDFTADENLPFWCGKCDDEEEVEMGKKCLTDCGVGADIMEEATGETVDPMGEFICEEEEQHSPVSVLDFPFREDEDEEQEIGAEEKAMQLLNQVLETRSSVDSKANVDTLLFDFFSHELTTTGRNQQQNESDCEMVRVAKAWISGQQNDGKSLAWKVESNREAYSRDMQRIVRWNKFEEEQEELVLDVEIGVLSYLVDELLADLSIP